MQSHPGRRNWAIAPGGAITIAPHSHTIQSPTKPLYSWPPNSNVM